MGIRALEHNKAGKDMVCSHNWVPIEEISFNLQKAVIASEDGTFLTHHGFDFIAMKLALKNNQKGKTATQAGLTGVLSDEGGNTQVLPISPGSNSDNYCTVATGITIPTTDQRCKSSLLEIKDPPQW